MTNSLLHTIRKEISLQGRLLFHRFPAPRGGNIDVGRNSRGSCLSAARLDRANRPPASAKKLIPLSDSGPELDQQRGAVFASGFVAFVRGPRFSLLPSMLPIERPGPEIIPENHKEIRSYLPLAG